MSSILAGQGVIDLDRDPELAGRSRMRFGVDLVAGVLVVAPSSSVPALFSAATGTIETAPGSGMCSWVRCSTVISALRRISNGDKRLRRGKFFLCGRHPHSRTFSKTEPSALEGLSKEVSLIKHNAWGAVSAFGTFNHAKGHG